MSGLLILLIGGNEDGMVAIGDPVGSGTVGSVLFVGAGSLLAQDNTKFFWDDTNNRLGIGTNAPSDALDVASLFRVDGASGRLKVFGSSGAFAATSPVFDFTNASTFNQASACYGMGGELFNRGGGDMYGYALTVGASGGVTMNAAYVVYATIRAQGGGTVITTGTALWAAAPVGTVTNAYGLLIERQKQAAVTTGYGVYQVDYRDVNFFGGVIQQGMGSGSGVMTNIGRANAQTSSGGIGNTAATTDDTLFTYSLPLNSLDANGKSVRGIASGHFASNGNNKQVKFWFAGTAVADSAVVTHNNVDWQCDIEVTRIDATHVSCVGRFSASGTADVITVTANLVVSDLTSNASVIKITGASPTTGAANDVLGYQMRTEFMN